MEWWFHSYDASLFPMSRLMKSTIYKLHHLLIADQSTNHESFFGVTYRLNLKKFSAKDIKNCIYLLMIHKHSLGGQSFLFRWNPGLQCFAKPHTHWLHRKTYRSNLLNI